jgi:hypothetical protein
MQAVSVGGRLPSSNAISIVTRNVNHPVGSAHKVILHPAGEPVMQAGGEPRIHVRAGWRVIKVDDKRKSRPFFKSCSNKSTGERHHKRENGVIRLCGVGFDGASKGGSNPWPKRIGEEEKAGDFVHSYFP